MFNKTVDSITKVFHQAIKDLENLEASKNKEITKITEARRQLNEYEDDARAEMSRAVAVRVKLQSIVS